MIPNKFKKIVFAFSDPGAAKHVLALADFLQNEREILLISDKEYDFYTYFKTRVIKVREDECLKLIMEFNPDLIFTGTSLSSCFEYNLICLAANFKIVSFSFIDHYTSYKQRFMRHGKMILPDFICLPDEKAYKIALNEFNDESKLLITGNQYFDFLKSWVPDLTRDEVYEKLDVDTSKQLFVYAPDPLSIVGGSVVYGMDEYSLLHQLLHCMQLVQNSSIHLVVQCHPKQNKHKIKEVIAQYPGLAVSLNTVLDSNTLISYSHLVIGMFSTILIEASILKRKVLICLFNFKMNDPLADIDIGMIITNPDLLQAFFHTKKSLV
jgi:hypothetical protein